MHNASKGEYAAQVAALPESAWQKPARSGPVSDNCLEIAALGDGTYALRDSTNPGFGAIIVNEAEMAAFVGSAKDGQFG
jgi:hypothetical protein